MFDKTPLDTFVRKARCFMQHLASALIFAVVTILLFLMGVNDQICKSICCDFVAIGLAFLAARVCYIYLMNRYNEKKAKQHRRRKVRTPKPKYVVATTPATASNMANRVIFDYEVH